LGKPSKAENVKSSLALRGGKGKESRWARAGAPDGADASGDGEMGEPRGGCRLWYG